MATDSHIRLQLITGGRVTRGSRCGSVGLNIFDHRRASDPLSVLFPCPRRYSSPRLYRAAVEDMATDICYNYLRLPPCCIAFLLPQLQEKINAAGASHRCYRTHYAELHIFPEPQPTADEILMESFEAAQPRTTPASRAWIEKIAAEKEGDDESSSSSSGSSSDDRSCMICLDDDIIPRRSCLKMPCSHVFHQSCIVEWLKVSHVCPLCRYQMPVDDNVADFDQFNRYMGDLDNWMSG